MWQNVTFVLKKIKRSTKDKNHEKVTNHCHYTVKYRGIAYSICKI